MRQQLTKAMRLNLVAMGVNSASQHGQVDWKRYAARPPTLVVVVHAVQRFKHCRLRL
jgi:hypothetical protein